ncbi:DUF4365 domain-containing protein [Cryomorpha ignava]|uniref:DUF4365 domain-containing protein n=1 Tax=Cryomorpha ignava TaxID=101383 RepID=A0A7K3WVV9_9FLAO|nr:DUF4365 domain-containing protein [Cryomorpha ignava]NEN24735.1 DUF4365 domain-containing protein [Cryomorpha ignava]
MAFDDEPIIDRNSEISEKSITEVKNCFSRRNGFVSHIIDGTDDYGVDIDCHVINDGKAKSFQFPIQVKSSDCFQEKEIDGSKYKTLNFRTSRLGYLIKFKPQVGIIVVYDDSENNCYYEFAFKVITKFDNKKIMISG